MTKISRDPRVLLATATREAASWYLAGATAVNTAKQAQHLWRKFTAHEVTVREDDPIYPDVHGWLLGSMPDRRRRSVVAKTVTNHGGFDPVTMDDAPDTWNLVLTYNDDSEFVVDVDGHRVRVRMDRPFLGYKVLRTDTDLSSAGRGESIVFVCPSRAAQDAVLTRLGRFATERSQHKREPGFLLLQGNYGWRRRNDVPKRTLQSVVLADGQMERLRDDLAQFLADEQEYAQRCIPWHRGYLLHGPPGTGKAQPLDTKILTPSGWREMGDLSVRDQVIGSAGQATEVTGVFDQGEREIFRLTLSDGSSVEADGDHLWLVQTHEHRLAAQPGRVLTTIEIRDALLDGRERAFYVPQMAAAQFDRQESSLPVDPYLLGLLLGDGTFRAKVEYCSADPELLNSAETLAGPETTCTRWADKRRPNLVTMGFRKRTLTGRPGGQGKSTLAQALDSLGLFGLMGTDKFIPEMYLRASVSDRLALLQGLMDTDGGAERTATVFYSSSLRLVEGVADVVELLGGTATVSSKIPYYGPRGGARLAGKVAHRVSIRLPDGMCPFRLTRKVDQWNARPHNPPVRSIVAVEPSRVTAARCIAIEAADNLYVTEHGIVTHNTSVAKALAHHFKMDLYYAPVGDITKDTDLLQLVSQVSPRSILLLEDVDAYAAAQEREDDPEPVDDDPEPFAVSVDRLRRRTRTRAASSGGNLSISGLLNSLDGIATPHGLVVMMTANHPDVLDRALIRPGRVDVVEGLGLPNDEHTARLFTWFYGQPPTGRVTAGGRSPAELSEVFKQHMHDPEAAEAALMGAALARLAVNVP